MQTTNDPDDMADDAVNEELARLRGWRDVCRRGKYVVGHDPDRPEHWPPVPIPNYCSPDAPNSLRVALVEAVIKAGAMEAFFARLSSADEGPVNEAMLMTATTVAERFSYESVTVAAMAGSLCGMVVGATMDNPTLSRAALTALRAAGSGKEQEGNES